MSGSSAVESALAVVTDVVTSATNEVTSAAAARDTLSTAPDTPAEATATPRVATASDIMASTSNDGSVATTTTAMRAAVTGHQQLQGGEHAAQQQHQVQHHSTSQYIAHHGGQAQSHANAGVHVAAAAAATATSSTTSAVGSADDDEQLQQLRRRAPVASNEQPQARQHWASDNQQWAASPPPPPPPPSAQPLLALPASGSRLTRLMAPYQHNNSRHDGKALHPHAGEVLPSGNGQLHGSSPQATSHQHHVVPEAEAGAGAASTSTSAATTAAAAAATTTACTWSRLPTVTHVPRSCSRRVRALVGSAKSGYADSFDEATAAPQHKRKLSRSKRHQAGVLLRAPAGVVYDPAVRCLYVADQLNHCIRQVMLHVGTSLIRVSCTHTTNTKGDASHALFAPFHSKRC